MIQVRARRTDSAVTIPDELMRSVPRHWKLTASGKCVLGAAVFMVVGAIAFSVGAYISAKKTSALKRAMAEEGQLVSGAVVKTYRTGDDHKRNVFHYEFVLDGKVYTGRTEIGVGHSPGYQAGNSVPIRYLPARPTTNWIDGYPPSGVPLFLIPVLGGAMLLVAYAMLRNLWRQEELVAEGRAVLARVKAVKRVRRGENRKQRAQLEFTLLSGAQQEAYLEFSRNAPQPDSTIVVVYDRENPRRVLRYPACLVRVEKPGEW
jgi:hypothetical protein